MKVVKDQENKPVKKRSCKRFYLVQLPTGVEYKRLDSISFFSSEDGSDHLRKENPTAKEIICLNRKAVKMLKIKEPKEYAKLIAEMENKNINK